MKRPKGFFLLAALFLGRFPGPDERGPYVSPQLTLLLVDRCMGFGTYIAVKQREGFLVGLGNLPPLEGPQLWVVPAHELSRRHGDPPLCARPTSELVLNNARYTRSVAISCSNEGRWPFPFLPLFTKCVEVEFSEVRAGLRQVASCSSVERNDPLERAG
jgi:hypothetical protein